MPDVFQRKPVIGVYDSGGNLFALEDLYGQRSDGAGFDPVFSASVVGAVMSSQSYVSLLSLIGEDQMEIVSTYTALPSAAQNYRRTYAVLDQMAIYLSDGANWLALTDRIVDKFGSYSAPLTFTGTTKLKVREFVIPAGCWKDLQQLDLQYTLQKSGTSENFTGEIRIGTTGTVSDQIVNGAAGGTLLGGSSDGGGVLLPIMRLSATSVQKGGNGSTGGSWAGGSATDVQAAVTVPNLDSNAVSVTLWVTSSAAVETLSLYQARALLSKA